MMDVDRDELRRAFGDYLKRRPAGAAKDEAAVELLSVWPRGEGTPRPGVPLCLYAVVTYEGRTYVVNPELGLCEPAIILDLDDKLNGRPGGRDPAS